MQSPDSTLPFDQFVLKFHKSLCRQTEVSERQRTQQSVLLQKRYVGATLGQRIGQWHRTTHNYVEPELLELDPTDIYTRNVIKKIVRANAATMSQAEIVVECMPVRENDIICKKHAMICQSIAEWTDEKHWTANFLLNLYILLQLAPGTFIKTECHVGDYAHGDGEDWKSETIQFDELSGLPSAAETGEYDSGSGLPNPEMPMEVPEEEPTELPEEMLIDVLQQAMRPEPEYSTNLKIVSPLCCLLDEQRSEGGNIQNGRFFLERELMSRFEIEQTYGIDDLAMPADWSFATKWQYTLKTGGEYGFKTQHQSNNTIQNLDLFEVFKLYLSCDFLNSYTPKYAYKFPTPIRNGFEFTLKAGENAGEAVRRLSAEDAEKRNSPVMRKGLCVSFIQDRVLGFELADFNQIFDYVYFLSNPSSAWGLAYSELETHQHLINQTLTAIGNQVQSNQNILILSRDAFDEDDVSGEKNFIYTREGSSSPIQDSFGIMPALPVTSDTWSLYQNMVASIDEDSLASKEMQGQPSGVKTLGQAQLNRDQSVGTLTPAMQSAAAAKVGAVHKQCEAVQYYQARQFLVGLCVSEDGTLTEEDIDGFLQSDLTQTVKFTYQRGSEIPKTRFDKQQDLVEYAGFLLQMGQVAPDAITPNVIQTILAKAAEYKNLTGIDPSNAELDKELAERRLQIIRESLEQAMAMQLQIPQDEQQLQANVLALVFSNPVLQPLPQENHIVAKDFWRDRAMGEMKKETPDLLFIQSCRMMLAGHSGALVTDGQEKTIEALESAKPAMEAEAAQQQQAAAGEAENANAEREYAEQSEAANREAENEKRSEEQDFALTQKLIDIEESEREREHQKEMQKQNNAKAKAKG